MSLTHITTCLLCDPLKPKQFAAAGIPDVKIGEQPPESVSKFLNALATHLAKEHPQALVSLQQMGAMFQALLLMKNFQSGDPNLQKASELARHFIHKLTQKEPVTNNAMLLKFDSIVEESPTGTVRPEDLLDLRDQLLEEGAYAPDATEAGRIVTA